MTLRWRQPGRGELGGSKGERGKGVGRGVVGEGGGPQTKEDWTTD